MSSKPACAEPRPYSDVDVADRRQAAVALLVSITVLLLLCHASALSMVEVWLRSATFAHGFVIVPIVCWLAWRQRRQLALLPLRPAPLALLPLALLGMVWLLARLAHVQVLHQLCLVLMLIMTVVAVVGVAWSRAIAFPLFYLLLAVPFGEVLIAPLIDFTTSCCVWILRLFAIPVFRENNHLTLPTGSWSVVEACSGLRYLIASLALGAVYAFITYRSWQRRAAFIAISLLLPIIANGLRAAMIILIGHWSDMTLAIGIDHLVYGTLFFGLVTAVLFWCGGRWREVEEDTASLSLPVAASANRIAGKHGVLAVTGAVIALTAIWPIAERLLTALQAPALASGTLQLAAPPAPWRAAPMQAGDWQALHQGAPQRWSANYHDGRRTISLQLTWYASQQKDAELLAPVPRITTATGQQRWHETPFGQRQVHVGGKLLSVCESVEQSASVKLLVWRWYRQQGSDTASPVWLKLMLARSKLLGVDQSAAEIVVATAYDEEHERPAARQAMAALLDAMWPAIAQGLRDAGAR